VIPTVIGQLMSGADAIRLGHLHPTRDLVYVSDTARGFLLADRAEAAVGQTVHLGTGTEISIGDLARLIIDVFGAEAKIVEDVARLRPETSEVDRLCADPSRAERILGWRPARAGREGLEAGLRDTVAWFRSRPGSGARGLEYEL
jgi:dTDP-glucose 4,6-dehydratase